MPLVGDGAAGHVLERDHRLLDHAEEPMSNDGKGDRVHRYDLRCGALLLEVDEDVAIAVHRAALCCLQDDGGDWRMDDGWPPNDIAGHELFEVVDVRFRHAVVRI